MREELQIQGFFFCNYNQPRSENQGGPLKLYEDQRNLVAKCNTRIKTNIKIYNKVDKITYQVFLPRGRYLRIQLTSPARYPSASLSLTAPHHYSLAVISAPCPRLDPSVYCMMLRLPLAHTWCSLPIEIQTLPPRMNHASLTLDNFNKLDEAWV